MSWSDIETDNQEWSSKEFTFTPAAVVGHTFDVAVSDIITNNGSADNMEVWVNFENVVTTPAQNGEKPFYLMFASIDEQIGENWHSVADSTQQQIGNYTPLPTEREMAIVSGMVFDEARPFPTERGFKFKFSKNPSANLRVRVSAQDAMQGGPAALDKVILSAKYRFY